jgi:precorrin-6B methylase 2
MDDFAGAFEAVAVATSGAEALVLVLLLLCGVSILVFTVVTGVPPMPTRAPVRDVLLDLVPEEFRPREIHDLGCGWGHLAIALARRHPDARVVGHELSPLPWLAAKLAVSLLRVRNLEIRYGDFRRADLTGADLVTCYLFLGVMRRVEAKLAAELRPGALVISNSFALPTWRPDRIEVVNAAMRPLLYRYRAGAG